MKTYVRNYRDFINEAYIDPAGELQDLDLNDISVMEAMSNLVNYLEAEPLVLLQLASDSFFDLLAVKGLDKIISSRI